MSNALDDARYFMLLHNMARARRVSVTGMVCVSDGPRHRPSWTATIQVNDCYFTAVGRTKSEAKDEAAKQALQALGFLDTSSLESL
ncbi:hypothetical protein FRC04_004833 [Tulasnella sp. 424]|nr:hypothetical protein FRC04_004833 [Tulasnella sp. 424]KAG8963744.1 hypothetical protein FRC05_004537 [Tulasnella sp. 425]